MTRSGAVLDFDKQDLVQALDVSPTFAPPAGLEYYPSGFEEYILHSRCGVWEAFKTKREAKERQAELEAKSMIGYDSRVGRVNPDGVFITEDVDSPFSWEGLARSRIMGLIQSRMYNGSWNSDVEQDFRLSYVGSSWVAKRGQRRDVTGGEHLTFANSTSFAFRDVVRTIRRSRWNVRWKELYAEGRLTLADLNARRASWGLDPIGETYMRRFKIQR